MKFYHIAKIMAFFGIPENRYDNYSDDLTDEEFLIESYKKPAVVIQDETPFSIALAVDFKGQNFSIQLMVHRFDQNGLSILTSLMNLARSHRGEGYSKIYESQVEKFRTLPIYSDHVIVMYGKHKQDFSHIDDAMAFLSSLFSDFENRQI